MCYVEESYPRSYCSKVYVCVWYKVNHPDRYLQGLMHCCCECCCMQVEFVLHRHMQEKVRECPPPDISLYQCIELKYFF